MAAPKKTIETNPELAFVDVDLLSLYRRLDVLPVTRAVKAGILEFVASTQEQRPHPSKATQALYRKMLRQLLELEATPPPKRRGGTVAGDGVGRRAVPG